MRHEARELLDLPLPAACAHGTYVAPAIYAIPSLKLLPREVFGPILHVVHLRRRPAGEVCEAINATGYGLTLGLHTRVQATADFVAARVKVGNMYVNRNQIGAVVGVQPFGGEGLSGTGPKTGGPNYLQGLCARAGAHHRPHRLRRQCRAARRGKRRRLARRNHCREAWEGPSLAPGARRSEAFDMAAQSKTPVKTESGGAVETARSSGAEVDAFLARVKIHDAGDGLGPRAADLRHGRDHEPAADLGYGAQASGRHVQRREGGWRARRAARLFPGLGETPREQMGRRSRGAGAADDAASPARAATRRSARCLLTPAAKASRPRSMPSSMSATAWRRISTSSARGRASLRCSACRCSCSRKGASRRPSATFKEIARLTRGAYCHFDAGSARQLRELLAAVAVYATGGRKALQDHGAATKSAAAVQLLEQLG